MVLQVLALPLLVIMAALVVTPAVAGLKLVSRLVAVRRQTLPGNRAEHAVHTGILVALLLIPLLVIGLWAVAVAGTQGSGTSAAPPTGPSPSLAAGNLVGTWKTSSGAAVVFTADGRFAETRLPGPLPGDAGNSGLIIPRAARDTNHVRVSPSVARKRSSRASGLPGTRPGHSNHHGAQDAGDGSGQPFNRLLERHRPGNRVQVMPVSRRLRSAVMR